MSEVKVRAKKNIFVQGAISPEFVAESIRKHSTQHAIGAHEIFLGQVRGDVHSEQGQSVSAMEYSAYEEMALDAMHELREETFAKFPIMCMHVYHSLGSVPTGQVCFFVFASSAHRQAAREAVAFVVDGIKDKLPIFGKEMLGSEGHVWKENK